MNSKWPLYQLDIMNAFLNRDLKEKVLMSLPPNFEEKHGNNKVCE